MKNFLGILILPFAAIILIVLLIIWQFKIIVNSKDL